MMQIMADSFPGAFSGYELDVTESHQRNKADTSGTAKEVVKSFQQMGVLFKEVSRQQEWRGQEGIGMQEGSAAYHTYT